MNPYRMNKLFLLLCLICIGISSSQAQTVELPPVCQKILKNKFRSWKLAEIQPDIIEYFKRERSYEQPNLIKGDWNGDDKTDYAILLENKYEIAETRIAVVFMKSETGYKYHILVANDCIMSVKKGKKDYDFETGKSFRYKTDAIFSYIWEKAGVSYVWEKGKFRTITTSD